MYHYVYLTERNPALTSSQFIDRWRRHAVLAASMPSFWTPIRRYVQNDVLPEGLPGVPGVATGFDALGEFFFDKRADRTGPPPALAADMEQIAGPHGRRRFGGERELLTGAAEGPYRVTRFLVRRSADSQRAVDDLREPALDLPALGVALSTSIEADLPHVGILTAWTTDLEAARALLVSDAWDAVDARARARSGYFEPLDVVSREIVLKEQ